MYNAQLTADLIKKMLITKKITAKNLCEQCGLGVNTISNIRRGDVKSVETFCTISDYLDCSIDYLLGRTDVPEINKSIANTHIIIIAARNGSFKELALNDEQLDELEKYVNSLPEITDL